jgi:hypothetical protein
MKNQFYELMQFDPARGVPSCEKLIALGLSEEAKVVWSETVKE